MATINGSRNLGIGIPDSSGTDEGTVVTRESGKKKKGTRSPKFPKNKTTKTKRSR